MKGTKYDLKWLLQKVDEETFLRKYFEKKSLLVQNKTAVHPGILSTEELDVLVSSTLLHHDAIRVVKDGRFVPEESYTDYFNGKGFVSNEKLLDHLADGYTLALEGIQRYLHNVNVLAKQLQQSLMASISVNCYVTPAAGKGFGLHFDSHCVFVLQLFGTKKWEIYRRPSIVLPVTGANDPGPAKGDKPYTVSLKPGDLLYLPRGVHHSARAQKGLSVHLTIGVYPLIRGEYYKYLVEQLIQEDSLMRGGLINKKVMRDTNDGTITKLKVRSKQKARMTMALKEKLLKEDIWPLQKKRFEAIVNAREVNGKSKLRIREGLVFSLKKRKRELLLVFNNKEILLPSFVNEDIQKLNAPCEVRALFAPASSRQKLELARLLLKTGFLQIAEI